MSLKRFLQVLHGIDPGPAPCVGSGTCCKSAPCSFGEADPQTGGCTFLEEWKDDDLGIERYRCGKYEHIMGLPGQGRLSPAFGAGCCATLFNDARENIILALQARGQWTHDGPAEEP